MRIALAQTRPVTGDMGANLVRHGRFIDAAVSTQAQLVIFPELSLTGYEPALADQLAINPGDPRLDVFQQLCNAHDLTIVAGAPTRNESGVCISLLVFQPRQQRSIYSKMHLHADEEPYFVPGCEPTNLIDAAPKIALAICYELSIPQHAQLAADRGAEIYIASVAKTAAGVDSAIHRLQDIAQKHAMIVLMANSIGPADNCEMAGGSCVISQQGMMLAQLDNASEGLLVFDTRTNVVVQRADDTMDCRPSHPIP